MCCITEESITRRFTWLKNASDLHVMCKMYRHLVGNRKVATKSTKHGEAPINDIKGRMGDDGTYVKATQQKGVPGGESGCT